MKLQKFNSNEIDEIAEEFKEAWSPRDIETINNDFVIRVAKFDGKYHWHKHDDEDELFLVFKEKIKIRIN